MKIVNLLAAVTLTLTCNLCAVSTAEAFQRGEGCDLKDTSDGFVALRKGPSARTRLVHKLRPAYHRVSPASKNNTWVFVDVGSPEAYDVPVSQQWFGEGYIRANLIDWSSCSFAG